MSADLRDDLRVDLTVTKAKVAGEVMVMLICKLTAVGCSGCALHRGSWGGKTSRTKHFGGMASSFFGLGEHES